MYPTTRMRRNRSTEARRRLACETSVTADDLILPLFVVPGAGRVEDIPTMPGQRRFSVDRLESVVAGLTVPAVLLFGVPDKSDKNRLGSGAFREDGVIPSAIRAIREMREDLLIITDVCLCAYTSHGHCGAVTDDGDVDNDRSLELLAEMALLHAKAGAGMVAPSAMMDGQVAALRQRLDSESFSNTAIMSYASKFASSFYGPFRQAAGSSPDFGDRRGYQLAPGNVREAVREALLDEQEGADWLMVKPALAYLDVIKELREATRLPLAAYQVSGEYAMLKFAAEAGAIDERSTVMESLLCIKRAGAGAVITYYADQVCKWIAS